MRKSRFGNGCLVYTRSENASTSTLMTRTLYVASTNPGKLRDFAVAAAAHDIRILPLPGLATIEPPAEDGPTFEDIARDKAIYYSRFLPGEIVLADDSGLEVDALHGAPGIRSARYAADAGFRADATTDTNNNLFLLQELAHIPDSNVALATNACWRRPG